MLICMECYKQKKLEKSSFVLVSGICKKHGSFSYNIFPIKISCEKCAIEQNKCQICGSEIG